MAQPWIRRPRRVQLCWTTMQILPEVENSRGQQHRTTFMETLHFWAPIWLKLAHLARLVLHVRPSCPTWFLLASNLAHLCSNWPNLAPTWPNLVPSWLNLAPTWPAKSSQNPPKLVPKSIKKGIKLPTNLWLDFSSALDTFFPKLASKLEGRGTQNH